MEIVATLIRHPPPLAWCFEIEFSYRCVTFDNPEVQLFEAEVVIAYNAKM